MADEIVFTVADTAPVLRRGEHGDWVRYLQQLLETVGHKPGAINSSFGSETEQAVKAFQNWVPMAATGVVDKATWEKLISSAETLEYADSARGSVAHSKDADHTKLDAGGEVGRKGWRKVSMNCIIQDFRRHPFPNTAVYVRFSDETGATSDEGGHTVDGVFRLHDIWVPNRGQIHLYINSTQRGPMGQLGPVEGLQHLVCKGDHIGFTATQTQGETRTATFEEAQSWGWMHGTTLEVGIDAKVVSTGAQVSQEHSGEHSYGNSEAMTFTFGGNGFTLEQAP
jgi:peptidoglycan hydrolase-like protein with peptidoglycan-binding domain